MPQKSFMSRLAAVLAAAVLTAAVPVHAAANLQELSRYAGISVSDLNAALSQAKYQQKIIDAMTRPSESKPWWQYRKIFITKSRIDAGVDFYLKHEQVLEDAERIYGVPPEIVCAIIGVETFYGKNMGTWKVLDALYTLGFNYPPRETYFSKEFANFVRLCQREHWDFASIKGSYAGAMGMGQFMPGSYLNYAVDFDQDGHSDLFTNPADAIGSVANYFKGHGWVSGRGIYYPVHLRNASPQPLMKKEWELTARELYASGASTKVNLQPDDKLRLFAYKLEDGTTGYAVGLNNFKTIMRYNTSQLYARAVYELSEFIRMGYAKAKQSQGYRVKRKGRQP